MRKFKFSKLVRDKIVNQIISAGDKPNWKVLTEQEYIQKLKDKIVEESLEIPGSDNKEETIKELADVQEIIDNLLDTLKISKKEFLKIQKEKNDKNGSFKMRHYIENVETTDIVTKWVQYYLDNPNKYPELFE